MLTRVTIELDHTEMAEFKEALKKLTSDQPSVEIKLNSTLRSACRQILKEIERWEDFRKEKW